LWWPSLADQWRAQRLGVARRAWWFPLTAADVRREHHTQREQQERHEPHHDRRGGKNRVQRIPRADARRAIKAAVRVLPRPRRRATAHTSQQNHNTNASSPAPFNLAGQRHPSSSTGRNTRFIAAEHSAHTNTGGADHQPNRKPIAEKTTRNAKISSAPTEPNTSSAFNRVSWSASLSARERPASNESAQPGGRSSRPP
jgi:hypothetical protein